MRDEAHHRIADLIHTRSAKCAVIGLGYIGTAFFKSLALAGYHLYGVDRSQAALDRFMLANSELLNEHCSIGIHLDFLSEADVVVVAVRTPVRQDGSLDLEPLESAFNNLIQHPLPARLVLVECTVPVGTTRRMAQLIQNHSGEHVFVAHVPERLRLEDKEWTIRNIPHLVGGIDAESTELAASFMATISDTIVPVSSPEVSELSKLLENSFLAVGISLLGEVTAIAHHHGLTATEVASAAATKPFGYFPFQTGPGIGGHCIPNDLELLRSEAHRAGLDLSLMDGVSAMIQVMPRQVVRRLAQLAAQSNSTLVDARVLVVGVGFKIGSHDTMASPAHQIIAQLRECGSEPIYVDSGVPFFSVDDLPVKRIDAAALGSDECFDFGVILSGDSSLEAALLCAAVNCLLDTGGGRILQGELTEVHNL